MEVSEPANAVIAGDTIEWNGALHSVSPQNGITIEAWDYHCNQFFQLNSSDHRTSLTIFYLLSPGNVFLVKTLVRKQKDGEHYGSPTFFIVDNNPVTFEVKTESSFRALVLKIDKDWLYRELKMPGATSVALTDQLITSQLEQGNCWPHEYLLASKLYDHVAANNTDKMLILSRFLLLLSDFFERSIHTSTQKIPKVPVEYFYKMLEVEHIITSSIKGKLPSLEVIAGRIAVSESGLKRYFSKLFGSNIHEYYIGLKMEAVKRMLVEKNLSVPEVSEFFGYDEPKHFIASFKKYFSFLPGEVLKGNHIIYYNSKSMNER